MNNTSAETPHHLIFGFGQDPRLLMIFGQILPMLGPPDLPSSEEYVHRVVCLDVKFHPFRKSSFGESRELTQAANSMGLGPCRAYRHL